MQKNDIIGVGKRCYQHPLPYTVNLISAGSGNEKYTTNTTFCYPLPSESEGFIVSKKEQNFWLKVNISDKGSCWNWQRYKNGSGYGWLRFNGNNYLAHRLAYQLWYGNIPDGMQVLHQCDNRICCNPHHLFLGTNSDNVRDKVSKNRQYQGVKHKSSKLQPEQVREIRSLYATGNYTTRQLAKRFGISSPGVVLIVNRKNWKGVE